MSRTFNLKTISYEAIDIETGCTYYLKRIEGFKGTNKNDSIEKWKKIRHPNINDLKDVHFGENCK